MVKTPPFPTVEEAERVIAHLLSYPDQCESTLDNVRHIMQWLTFERPTEKALATHCRILCKPVPDGIRPDVAYVPTTRHRTTMIVEGVLKGYLEWIKANHPETGDDVDPDAPKEPHISHHIIVHDNLGGTPQTEVCGWCGKSDDNELAAPCPAAHKMEEEETAYRFNRLAAYEEAMKDFPSLAITHGPESLDGVREWYRKHIVPLRREDWESEPGEHQVVLDAINGCNSGEDE